MDNIDVTELFDLPKLDYISFDFYYSGMPLFLFCKKLGITKEEFMVKYYVNF